MEETDEEYNTRQMFLEQFITRFEPPEGALKGLKITLCNGPPGSGKDTLSKHLANVIERSVNGKFSEVLKRSVYADFGLPDDLPIDYFDPVKELPSPLFFGKSFREAVIYKSEDIVKPIWGQYFYGQMFLRKLWNYRQNGVKNVFVSDSGFAPEAMPVIEAVGIENVTLIRIHAEKRGLSFKGDSRSYITLPGVKTYDIENNTVGSVYQFLEDGLSIVKSRLNAD